MFLSNLDCGSGSFDLAPLSFTSLGMCSCTVHADRRIAGCHLVSRGCGMTRSCVLGANARFPTEYFKWRQGQRANVPCRAHADGRHAWSNLQHAKATSSGRLSNHTTCCNRMCLLCQFWFVSCFAVCSCTKQTDVVSSITSLAGGAGWCGCVCLGPTLGFQPGMTARAMGSNGLMNLAGRTPRHWPVSSRPRDCRASCPGLHRVAWEDGFAQVWHTQLLHTQLFYTQFSHTQLVDTLTQIFHNLLTHTQRLHTQLFHPHTSHTSNTHTHTDTTLAHTTVF